MLLARMPDGTIDMPTTTGQRATCPGCGARVDAAVGELVIAHWRHHGERDCDSWSGGETDWHLGWKAAAVKTRGWHIEVPFGLPPHRADAVGPKGHIVEFQHSSLSSDDMDERAAFYAERGPVIWVLDGTTSWAKRWKKWRYEGTDHAGLLVLDTGDKALCLDPVSGEVRSVGRSDLFDRTVASMAMRVHTTATPCFTCGDTPDHHFPDGSPAYSCSHTTEEETK